MNAFDLVVGRICHCGSLETKLAAQCMEATVRTPIMATKSREVARKKPLAAAARTCPRTRRRPVEPSGAQVEVCRAIFLLPIPVLAGHVAGWGKPA